ncbi:hypothetical protein Syun_014444 [Stephania yunnanensis]|uniref:Uncharacterized protein n=1 Tax=Stephania yunnanensis TaxID=152371 RepID=A0AAP0P9K5_9MAGN
MKAFSFLLIKAESPGDLKGFKLNVVAPSISHLFFLQMDSLLFCRAMEKDICAISNILTLFSRISRQFINKDKSHMAFSSNVSSHLRYHLSTKIGISARDNIEKYLGILMEQFHKKSYTVQLIIDRLTNRVFTWKEKFFSPTGNEVLVRIIAQVILVYSMSTFLLPKKVAYTLQQLIAKYWWSSSHDKASLGRRRSWKWKGLIKARKLQNYGVRWRVDKGGHIHIWKDPWVANKNRTFLWTKRGNYLSKVADLIDQSSNTWNVELINSFFLTGRSESYY